MIKTIAACFLALSSLPAGAAQIYTVSVQTSSLPSGANPGPFALDFQFLDGGGTGTEPNNTAIVSQFNFGSGIQNIAPLTLTDNFPSDQQLAVTLGTMLSFQVSITNNPDIGAAPDAFSFRILSNGQRVATTQPSGALLILTAPANGNGPVSIQTFDAPGAAPVFSPSVQAAAGPVPEPSAFLMAAIGLGLIAFARHCYRGARTR